jgi:hypothetical protein
MPFNADKFDATKFEHRTAEVQVDALAAYFDEGEPLVWKVRGMSATELYKTAEARNRQESTVAIVKAIANNVDQVTAVRKALGLTSDVPGEIVKRLEMLVMASLAPKIELPTAVKLAEHFPIEFMLITNQITELTGRGADVVKPSAASQPTTA